MGDDWEYKVRHRAYELWHEAGRPDGKHLQFWEAAEQELQRLRKEAARDQHHTTDGTIKPKPGDEPVH